MKGLPNKMDNRDKFILRFMIFIITIILYGIITYTSISKFEYWSGRQRTPFISLVIIFPIAFMIYIYGEVNKVFEKGKKEKSKHKKIYFISAVVWTILFIAIMGIIFFS